MTHVGTVLGTAVLETQNASPEYSGKALVHNDFANSWGRTRTVDPGIMSAVL